MHKMTIRTIPRGYQKNKLNLTLDNSELDFFQDMINKCPVLSMKDYLQDKIDKARKEQWL